jgi:hypothetical protein
LEQCPDADHDRDCRKANDQNQPLLNLLPNPLTHVGPLSQAAYRHEHFVSTRRNCSVFFVVVDDSRLPDVANFTNDFLRAGNLSWRRVRIVLHRRAAHRFWSKAPALSKPTRKTERPSNAEEVEQRRAQHVAHE